MPLVQYVEVDREQAMGVVMPSSESRPWTDDTSGFYQIFTMPYLKGVIERALNSCVEDKAPQIREIVAANVEALLKRWFSEKGGDQLQALLDFRLQAHRFFCERGLNLALPAEIVDPLLERIRADFNSLTRELCQPAQLQGLLDEVGYLLSAQQAGQLIILFQQRLPEHLQSERFAADIRQEIVTQLEKDYHRSVFYGTEQQRAAAVERLRRNEQGGREASLHFSQGDVTGEHYKGTLDMQIYVHYFGCQRANVGNDAYFSNGFGFLDRDGQARSFYILCDRINPSNWVIVVQLNADARVHLRRVAFFKSSSPLPTLLRGREDIFQGEFDQENQFNWQQDQDFSAQLRVALNHDELHARLQGILDGRSRVKMRRLAFINALPHMLPSPIEDPWKELDPKIDQIIARYSTEAGWFDSGFSFSSRSSSSYSSDGMSSVGENPICEVLQNYKTALKDEVTPLLVSGERLREHAAILQNREAVLNKINEVSQRFCDEELDVIDAESRAVFKIAVNAITLVFTLSLANWYNLYKTGDFLFFNRSKASDEVRNLAKETIVTLSSTGG